MNISVIIPVYNVEKYVERCILSIMSQTYTESVECIVVNDCTPDNSMKIVEKMVSGYKGQIQFKLLYHKHNRGIAAVRNTGLDAASGDYIIYIDSDDYCEPDMLEKMYAKAVEEDADIVVADYWDTNANYEINRVCYTPNDQIEQIKGLFWGTIDCQLWVRLVRRSLYLKNGIRTVENIDNGEDYILTLFLTYYASKIVHLSIPFVHHILWNSTSYTNLKSRKTLEDHFEGEKHILHFCFKKGMQKLLKRELLRMRITNMQELLLFTKGRLQQQYFSYYADITPIDIVRDTFLPNGISLYWRVACFFASLKMLWMHNLMRTVWTVLRKKQAQRISFFSE